MSIFAQVGEFAVKGAILKLRQCNRQPLSLLRGKSGLHRAACRLTTGGARSKRVLRKVPQKIYRRGFGCGKGEMVR